MVPLVTVVSHPRARSLQSKGMRQWRRPFSAFSWLVRIRKIAKLDPDAARHRQVVARLVAAKEGHVCDRRDDESDALSKGRQRRLQLCGMANQLKRLTRNRARHHREGRR